MLDEHTVEKNGKAISLKVVFFYLVMLVPAVALIAVLGIFILGYFVTSVMQSPATLDQAPSVIQMLHAIGIPLARARDVRLQQRDCVEFDPETLYRPRPGRYRFNNVEFSTILSFDRQGMRLSDEPAGGASDGASTPDA